MNYQTGRGSFWQKVGRKKKGRRTDSDEKGKRDPEREEGKREISRIRNVHHIEGERKEKREEEGEKKRKFYEYLKERGSVHVCRKRQGIHSRMSNRRKIEGGENHDSHSKMKTVFSVEKGLAVSTKGDAIRSRERAKFPKRERDDRKRREDFFDLKREKHYTEVGGKIAFKHLL